MNQLLTLIIAAITIVVSGCVSPSQSPAPHPKQATTHQHSKLQTTAPQKLAMQQKTMWYYKIFLSGVVQQTSSPYTDRLQCDRDGAATAKRLNDGNRLGPYYSYAVWEWGH